MTIKEIDELFSRGVGDFIDPDGSFKNKIIKKSKGNYDKDIIIKLGADPTKPDLHLGHAVVLRRLRKFQDLGCKIVFIIGDFTTLIGDPTGKSKVRPKIQKEEEENKTGSVLGFAGSGEISDSNTEKDDFYEIPSSAEIAKNMKTYIEQVGKILLTDEKHFAWVKNSDWFMGPTDINYNPDVKVELNIENKGNKLSINFPPNSFVGKAMLFEKSRSVGGLKNNRIVNVTLRGLLWTLQAITHNRLIERDMFQERLKKGEELYMHEMLYPVIQGIDSYVLSQIFGSCDLETGGTDQTFNIIMGRDVMKVNNIEQQSVLTLKVLEGLDGKEKMSKSLNNYIAITDEPSQMFGKTMSIPDSSIANYFELCTFTPMEEIEEIKKTLELGKVNPKDIKMRLAREIVAIYHGEEKANKAEEDFVNVFQNKEIPDEIEEVKVNKKGFLSEVLVSAGLIKSKSEFSRLVGEGAIQNLDNEEKISDIHIKIENSMTLKIGKKRFVKIVIHS